MPSRKILARHIGPLYSIRGKSGCGRSGGEPYRRVAQTCGESKSRRALRVAETLRFFLLLVRLLITVLQVTSQRRGKLFEVWDNDPLSLFLVA